MAELPFWTFLDQRYILQTRATQRSRRLSTESALHTTMTHAEFNVIVLLVSITWQKARGLISILHTPHLRKVLVSVQADLRDARFY